MSSDVFLTADEAYEELWTELREGLDHRTWMAVTRVLPLMPEGGAGQPICPPWRIEPKRGYTFSGWQWIDATDGTQKRTVLLDSRPSQNNRMEEALRAHAERLEIPHVIVRRTTGSVSSMDLPHRIFDPTIVKSKLSGERFNATEIGKALASATMWNASTVFEHSPANILFGGRNIHCTYAPADFRSVLWSDIWGNSSTNWQARAGASPLLVFDDIVQNSSLSLSGVHWYHFDAPSSSTLVCPSPTRCQAAKMVIVALGLFALTAMDDLGYRLRTDCHLRPVEPTPFRFVRLVGQSPAPLFWLDSATAANWVQRAVETARDLGLRWGTVLEVDAA